MSDGRLTKTAIKEELNRRIKSFEEMYKFSQEDNYESFQSRSHHVSIAFGRYCALKEMLWQIDNGVFVGGFTS